MSDLAQKLAARLRQEGEKSLAFFRALPEGAWEREVYHEGARWTVHQVLAHFVEAEDSIRRLVEHILDGGDGVPEDFDLDLYNERHVARIEALSREELYRRFHSLRERTAEMVAGFDERDLEQKGRHPFLGIAEVADIVKLMYRHNLIHQRELRRALR